MRVRANLICLAILLVPSWLVAKPLVSVYQFSEYPGPDGPHNPSGLVFEVCSDGAVYRAKRQHAGAYVERGMLSQSDLDRFKASLEKEWLGALRKQCKAHGLTLHAAFLGFSSGSHEGFECDLYSEGQALEKFRTRALALELAAIESGDDGLGSKCN